MSSTNEIGFKNYTAVIHSILPYFEESQLSLPFESTRIDSMDLLTIRVEFEHINGRHFTDSEWLSFKSLSEIISFCEKNKADIRSNDLVGEISSGRKAIQINMPQMAIGALSENWLFKELGDMHWEMLCKGLDTPSFLLQDELKNRLYATFVRVRIQSTIPFIGYIENEMLNIDKSISRYGSGMYFSNFHLASSGGQIIADLMTSFSIRKSSDNTKLIKSEPFVSVNSIHPLHSAPEIASEYRLLKKGEKSELSVAGIRFLISKDEVYSTEYDINPYYDLNGVGLLYFAAYPIINNTCEARFFNREKQSSLRWEEEYHVLARDVLYFANCNINDKIRYVLNDYQFLEGEKVKVNSSLYRMSDNVLMARIFTVKMKAQ